MRASPSSRLAPHPIIAFGTGRTLRTRLHLGLMRPAVVYHAAPSSRRAPASVRSLRASTSTFRFPVLGRLGQMAARRARLQLGSPRARRG